MEGTNKKDGKQKGRQAATERTWSKYIISLHEDVLMRPGTAHNKYKRLSYG